MGKLRNNLKEQAHYSSRRALNPKYTYHIERSSGLRARRTPQAAWALCGQQVTNGSKRHQFISDAWRPVEEATCTQCKKLLDDRPQRKTSRPDCVHESVEGGHAVVISPAMAEAAFMRRLVADKSKVQTLCGSVPVTSRCLQCNFHVTSGGTSVLINVSCQQCLVVVDELMDAGLVVLNDEGLLVEVT